MQPRNWPRDLRVTNAPDSRRRRADPLRGNGTVSVRRIARDGLPREVQQHFPVVGIECARRIRTHGLNRAQIGAGRSPAEGHRTVAHDARGIAQERVARIRIADHGAPQGAERAGRLDGHPDRAFAARARLDARAVPALQPGLRLAERVGVQARDRLE